jgi:hypothetical protein
MKAIKMNRCKLEQIIVSVHPIVSFLFVFFFIGAILEYLGYILGIVYWAILYALYFLFDIKITMWSLKKQYEPIIYINNFLIYIILMIFCCYMWEDVQYWWEEILYVFIFHTILQSYGILVILKNNKE